MKTFARLLEAGRHEEAMATIKAYKQPVYDYGMVDDNFLLAPLARDLLTVTSLNDAALHRLFKGPADTRLTGLAANLELVLTAADSESFQRWGIPLLEDSRVGTWRDSANGLGGGRYPGDVNAFHVPAALTAIGELLAHPLIKQLGFHKLVEEGDYPSLFRATQDPAWLNTLLARWENIGRKHHVNHPLPHIRSHIKDYLKTVTTEEKEYFLDRKVSGDCPVKVFVTGRCYPDELASGLRFSALALDKSGSPLPILNSDPVFALFDSPLPDDVLAGYLRAMTLPFPVGLWTPVGPLVATPVYANNVEMNSMFGTDRYHGMVIWGWVQGMLELGLLKQRNWLLKYSGGCGNACNLLDRLKKQLAQARTNVAGLATRELWTWKVTGEKLVPVAFGAHAQHETMANAVQLWSTVWLSVYHAEQLNTR